MRKEYLSVYNIVDTISLNVPSNCVQPYVPPPQLFFVPISNSKVVCGRFVIGAGILFFSPPQPFLAKDIIMRFCSNKHSSVQIYIN